MIRKWRAFGVALALTLGVGFAWAQQSTIGGQTSRPKFQQVEIEQATPLLLVDETDAAANERSWLIRSSAGLWALSTATDAAPITASANAIVIDRTGTTVDSINLTATAVQVNSAAIATRSTGSFTGTLTGFSANPTGTVNYSVSGTQATLYITAAITGTSNATTMTMTGLPAAVQPTNTKIVATWGLEDNTAVFSPDVGSAGVASISGGTVTFMGANDTSSASVMMGPRTFTSSATKGLRAGWSITYDLN